VLSAAWYQLAGDASPGIVGRRCGHGAYREARSGATPIIAGRGAASRADGRGHGNGFLIREARATGTARRVTELAERLSSGFDGGLGPARRPPGVGGGR
jgi:hypothetical protein